MLPLRHFSSEVVERCLYLFEMLHPCVANEPVPKRWGPLTTTFLLAMAMPLIVIPMERIADTRRDSPIGDREKDRSLTARIDHVLGRRFGESGLTEDGAGKWSYFQTSKDAKPKEWVGREVFEASRRKSADALETRKVLLGLRNALSHGNVLYLSANGEGTGNAPAEVFAFVWDQRNDRRQTIARNVLVVHQVHFAELIRRWASLINSQDMRRFLKAA